MSNNDCTPTLEEVHRVVKDNFSTFDPHALEWLYANLSGWNDDEYKELLVKYLQSTQLKIKSSDDATKLKGIPLEELARYFLEKGGIAFEVKELKSEGVWQIDGQGRIKTSYLVGLWQPDILQEIGSQLFLECKNHQDKVSTPELGHHHSRMVTYKANLSVIASTSGFSVGRGKGIAETVFLHSYQKRYHLLLAVDDFCVVTTDGEPPLAVLTRALDRLTTKKYSTDKDVQKKYSEKHCHQSAKQYLTELN